MVMTSCLPKGGQVLSVSVYPSEFGLERTKIESTKGPAALVDVSGSDGEYSGDDDDDDDDDEEDSSDTEHDSEAENNKLRTYELNRLRLVTKWRRIVFFLSVFLGLTEKSMA